MKKLLSLCIIINILIWFNTIALAIDQTISPEQALQLLMDGNKRFVAGKMINTKKVGLNTRQSLANQQKPYAIILSCSDSRVPPEIIFDQGLGEIFVVRVAGNVLNQENIGSIEYAVEHLNASLIMVLSHERCGAITAAVNTHGKVLGHIKSIIRALTPAVTKAKHQYGTADKANLIEKAININTQLMAAKLIKQSKIIRKAVHTGKVKIVPAKYDLDTGEVLLNKDF